MTSRHDLEASLADLAEHVDWPAADLAPRVAEQIVGSDSPARVRPLLRRPAVALVAAALLAVVLTPWGRSAVAGLLGLAGIEIRWGDIAEAPSAETIDLGKQTTVDEAVRRVDFRVLVPHDPLVGPPTAIYVADSPPGGRVDMVWATMPLLPAIGDTGVGMLYTQFAHGDSPGYSKEVGEGTEVVSVIVRGQPGLWIEGAPHTVTRRGDDSGVGRLAANVLMWDEGGVTHRLETTLTLEEAQRIVGTLAPG
jgi:hypothetical protein